LGCTTAQRCCGPCDKTPTRKARHGICPKLLLEGQGSGGSRNAASRENPGGRLPRMGQWEVHHCRAMQVTALPYGECLTGNAKRKTPRKIRGVLFVFQKPVT
jgi:hypothetical protein